MMETDAMPVDFTGMTDQEIENVRLAAVAEFTARGEKAQFMRQAESFVTTAFNRGYDKTDVIDALTQMVEKVYATPSPEA